MSAYATRRELIVQSIILHAKTGDPVGARDYAEALEHLVIERVVALEEERVGASVFSEDRLRALLAPPSPPEVTHE